MKSKKFRAIVLAQLFFSLAAVAQLLPPGYTNNGGTNVFDYTYTPPPYVPGLKLAVSPLSGTNLPINLLEADPAGKYDIYFASNLISSTWNDILQGTNSQTNFTLTIPQSGLGFFRASRTDTPITNAASMVISLPDLATTNLITANISGGPAAAMAILVDNSDFSNATWIPFSSSPYVLVETNDGTYDVWFGLRGSDGQVYWQMYPITLETSPLALVITNPTSVVSQPIIQLQGYSSKALTSISYDLTNSLGLITNQPVLITSQYYDFTNGIFTTNYFQAFDVSLAQGSNTITIHASDFAGNTTTTNFNLTVDYASQTNPPIVQLFWPQNGTQISGTNFILRGWINDPTAQISVQVVDPNSNTNVVSGMVGRDGLIWATNLPLANGTNSLALSATDAAGNTFITNFNVFSSSVVLTINNVQAGQTTITGTINTNDYTIWVNGVMATENDDGTWEADSVPTYNGAVQTRGIPDSDNGGSGSGSDTSAMGNPFSSQAVDAAFVISNQSGIYVNSSIWYYSEQQGSSFNNTFLSWGNGLGGTEINNTSSLIIHSVVYWGISDWPAPEPNGLKIFYWNDGHTSENPSYNIADEEFHKRLTYKHVNTASMDPAGGIIQEQGQMELNLATGGVPGSKAKNLWLITAQVSKILNPGPFDPDEFPWNGAMEVVTSVPPQDIMIGSLGNLDTNGDLYVELPENIVVDVTPHIDKSNDYTLEVSAVLVTE